jgi:hypothetical protein
MHMHRLLARLLASPVSAFASLSRAIGLRPPSVLDIEEERVHSARPYRIKNWLEEGKRLRIRRDATAGARQDRPMLHLADDLSASARERGHARIGTTTTPLPRLGGSANTPNLADTPGEGSLPQVLAPMPAPAPASQPVFALPPDILVEFGGDYGAATLDAIESMDETQRRLVFLRYLVRQGVYNEGFGDRRLPEQYRRSRGLDGPMNGN